MSYISYKQKMLNKRKIAFVLVFSMIVNALIYSTVLAYGEEYTNYSYEATQKYTDVPVSYWAFDAINQVSAKKWFNGYPDGTFRPENTITRAEAAKVFAEFLGLEIVTSDNSSFYDVNPNEWYAPYVEAARELFPVHTTIQGKRPFNPELPVTREDVIYALVKSLGCINDRKYVDLSVVDMLDDADSISADVKPYVAVALMEKLVSGYPDNTIKAQSQLTRAEFAVLLLRGTQHGFHDNYGAKIQSVTVYPEAIDIEAGETVILTARALYTDGKNLDYDAIEPYDSLNSGIVNITNNTIIGLKSGTTTIKFNSDFLKDKELSVNVREASKGPKFVFNSYPNETENATVTITGRIEETTAENITLTCNGQNVEIQPDLTFAYEAKILYWTNEFVFVATDIYGGKTEKRINIEKPSNPEIIIENYKENTTSKQEIIYGRITNCDAKSVTLTCNDELVNVSEDGSFKAEVTLWLMGKNDVKLTVVNKYGKTDTEKFVITRYEFYKGE